jgi:hypothetical protein
VLPIEFRRELGITPGDVLVAWLEAGRIVIQSRAALQQELWDTFRGVGRSLADELLAERRTEAPYGRHRSLSWEEVLAHGVRAGSGMDEEPISDALFNSPDLTDPPQTS